MTMRRIFLITSLVITSLALGVLPTSQAADKTSVAIGTAGIVGAFYPLGGGLAMVMEKNSDLIEEATAQVTAGSVENCRLVGTGQLEFSLANLVVAGEAYHGGKRFGKGFKTIRTCFWANLTFQHLVVHKGKGYKSLKDLKGKKISIGAPGSGTAFNVTNLIDAYGMKLDDFQVQYTPSSTAIDTFKDGRLDGMVIASGMPFGELVALAMVRDIDILSIPDEIIEKLEATFPAYVKAIIPVGTYKGVDRKVQTFGPACGVIAYSGLSPDIVYEAMKAVEPNLGWLAQNVHRGFGEFRFHPSISRVAPLHPGAIRYYKEKGLLK